MPEENILVRETNGEYIRDIVLSPVMPIIAATCLEAITALTTGTKFGLTEFVQGIKNISPVIGIGVLSNIAFPYKSTRKYHPAKNLIAGPIAYTVLGALGSVIGGVFNPQIISNIGHYTKYALKAGVVAGVIETFRDYIKQK